MTLLSGWLKMTEEELSKIFELHSAAIIAPAGHGKTEMIVDIVNYSSGKQLLLTHTNAGVDALLKRLKKRNIPIEKYLVTTIAAFCIKWCLSYENTGNFNRNLSPLNGKTEAQEYYAQVYSGAKKIFETAWAGDVLKATYAGIIVDEYQDCIQAQHEIVLTMNRYLPVRVLGDPMQGIFSFTGALVNWACLGFPIVDIVTEPWRWKKSNPDLGTYLMDVREQLLPALNNQRCSIQIDANNKHIKIVEPNMFTGYSHLKEFEQYSSVVYITKWPNQQLDFCTRMAGIFQYDETQDCDDLYIYAKLFDDRNGAQLALTVIDFVANCSTKVGVEISSYIKRLQQNSFDFSRIKKHIDFGKIIGKHAPDITKETILNMLVWFSNTPVFKQYRKELFSEMQRSVKYAIDHDMLIFEAANHIRKDVELQRRYTDFKYLSSRTVLSKGLEFDCVIIDMRKPLSAKDFYVAMTRAMKKVYIIADSNIFNF